jgi:hypothetical protein
MLFTKKAASAACLFIAGTNAAHLRGHESITHESVQHNLADTSTFVCDGTALTFAADGTCTVNGVASTLEECTAYTVKSFKMAAGMKQSIDIMNTTTDNPAAARPVSGSYTFNLHTGNKQCVPAIQLQVGTSQPAQLVPVIFDIGSPMFWIPSNQVYISNQTTVTPPTGPSDFFQPERSTTIAKSFY